MPRLGIIRARGFSRRRRYHSIRRRGLETSDVQLRVRPPGRPFKGSGLFVCRISSVFGRYRRTGSMAFNETMMETREGERERGGRPSLSTLMRLVFLRVARELGSIGRGGLVESWRVSVGATIARWISGLVGGVDGLEWWWWRSAVERLKRVSEL